MYRDVGQVSSETGERISAFVIYRVTGTTLSNRQSVHANDPKCSQVYQRLCNLLTVPDVALLIYALECVYSLSSLGQTACNAFLNCFGALEVLMSLLTVEVDPFRCDVSYHFTHTRFQAQSYGSKARILMNVVETVADGEPVQSLAQFSNVQPQPRMQVTAAQPSTPTPNSTLVVSSSTAPSSPLQLTKLNPSKLVCTLFRNVLFTFK